ncbi:MAG TPA: glycine cleavage system protein GcvH [Alphaproteobacteria bacterium]|nr:glycine cleavage system protein GcvH [Alphaproteobacteria bacterium]HIM71757.1 glycine cleavage system protein GcvH [Alphaproteobacteria bacterium]HIN91551.1 glycine cleavage system protein GcvH [Alphaproteobacteria bacterium]HIO00911.1 glycine cleavage system protein GcvH [Alphaproteobacteria bacterium]
MAQMKYTEKHEWILLERNPETNSDVGIVGITDYAQQQLGDIVFVELPNIGAVFSQGDEAVVIESVKAASELYTPITGKVTAVNGDLAEQPGLINTDPTGNGWFIKIRLSEPAELEGLMDEEAYQAFIADLD